MEELKQLLLQVSDCYPDFVSGVLAEARDYPEKLDDLKQYIKDNPEADTSDIGAWTLVNIQGMDLDNPVPLEIVDDDEDAELN